MSRLRVTDHALVRLLERGGGLPIEDLRASLESALERAHSAARSLGDSDYLIKLDGLTYVVRGDQVRTVVDRKDPVSSAATLAQHRV